MAPASKEGPAWTQSIGTYVPGYPTSDRKPSRGCAETIPLMTAPLLPGPELSLERCRRGMPRSSDAEWDSAHAACSGRVDRVGERADENNTAAIYCRSEIMPNMEETDARLLREVPGFPEDKRRGEDHDEERSPRNPGCLPGLRDQYVPHRQVRLAPLRYRGMRHPPTGGENNLHEGPRDNLRLFRDCRIEPHRTVRKSRGPSPIQVQVPT